MAMSKTEFEFMSRLADIVLVLAKKVDNTKLSDSERIDLTIAIVELQDMRMR